MNSEVPLEDFWDCKCPYCEALNSFPRSAAGLTRECINCLAAFLVPTAGQEFARKLPLPVEAERVRLRRFAPDDWKDLLEFECETEAEATKWLHRVSQMRFAELRQPFFLAIASRGTGKVIGSLSLMFMDAAMNQIEIALSTAQTNDLEGFELEALKAALGFCFQDLNTHRVTAQCVLNDGASRDLYQQAGMRKEAEFMKHYWLNGQWLSTAWFAILEGEYFVEPPARLGRG
jgi:RimJ/RimL family protein N-acetyltransferase